MLPGRILRRSALCALLSSILYVSPASATPIVWKFTGILGQTGANVLALPASSPFEWVVNLDFSAPNACDPSTDQGRYTGIGSGTLQIGGQQWTGGAGSVEVNTIQGACPGPSPAGVSFRQFGWSSNTAFPLVPLSLIGSLDYPTRGDGTMPTLPPSGAFVTWIDANPFNSFDVWTTVGDATPVPEPATLTLLGSGLVTVAWRRRRARVASRAPRESGSRRSA